MSTNARSQVEGTDSDHYVRVPIASGVLVYEPSELGKELVGFEDVTDWADVADALRARGHGVGAIHHLPEFDAEEA